MITHYCKLIAVHGWQPFGHGSSQVPPLSTCADAGAPRRRRRRHNQARSHPGRDDPARPDRALVGGQARHQGPEPLVEAGSPRDSFRAAAVLLLVDAHGALGNRRLHLVAEGEEHAHPLIGRVFVLGRGVEGRGCAAWRRGGQATQARSQAEAQCAHSATRAAPMSAWRQRRSLPMVRSCSCFCSSPSTWRALRREREPLHFSFSRTK